MANGNNLFEKYLISCAGYYKCSLCVAGQKVFPDKDKGKTHLEHVHLKRIDVNIRFCKLTCKKRGDYHCMLCDLAFDKVVRALRHTSSFVQDVDFRVTKNLSSSTTSDKPYTHSVINSTSTSQNSSVGAASSSTNYY